MARYLPLLVAASIAGCGSSGPGSSGPASDHSGAGVKAAGQEFVADVDGGHYSEACEAFTAKARASLAKEPGGCTGALPRLDLVLGKELQVWFTRVLPHIQVQGDTALSRHGVVEARYEHGRWHLESDVW
jgi:hypothetical protein